MSYAMSVVATPGPPRPLPYTVTPHWVTLADVSPVSKTIYNALRLQIDPDGVAKVRMTLLANLVGYSRSDKISKYVRELERIGAIRILRGPSRALTEVYVRTAPPDDYAGPKTLAEWIAGQREQEGRR